MNRIDKYMLSDYGAKQVDYDNLGKVLAHNAKQELGGTWSERTSDWHNDMLINEFYYMV